MNLQLISFKEYPKDQFTRAICTLCIDEKHMVSYGKKILKDGREFWATANHSVQDDDNKKIFIEGYLPESRSMEKQIKDFITDSEKKSRSEVAVNERPPF